MLLVIWVLTAAGVDLCQLLVVGLGKTVIYMCGPFEA